MKNYMNLMTERSRGQHLSRTLLIFWLRLSCVVLLFFVPMALSRGWNWYDSKQTLEETTRQYEPIRDLRNKNTQLKQRLENLTQQELILVDLAENRSILSLFGLVNDAILQSDRQVVITDLEFAQPVLIAPPENTKGAIARAALSLAGVATDQSEFDRFVESLRSSELFQDITIDTHQQPAPGEEKLLGFSIDCHFLSHSMNQ